MSSDPPELGKGLFGYRKSAVNQIIADRDIMLRQAEGRVRAAESKVADLETELGSMRDRNSRMDEQIERLRLQLDALSKGSGIAAPPEPAAAEPAPATAWEEQPAPSDVEPPGVAFTEEPTYHEEAPTTPAYVEEPAYHEDTPAPAYVEEPAYPEETPAPAYAEEEPLEGEGEWTRAEEDWPAGEEPAPIVEAEAGSTAAMSDEDDLPYGVEVQLGEDTVSESSEPEWMQTGPALGEEQEEHDEVAMAGSGYAYGDFDSTAEEQRYGDFGSEESEEKGPAEAPSPFSRYPFTSEPFDHVGPESAPAAETEGYQEESVAEPPAAESPRPGPAVSSETTDITNRFLTEELAGVLAAAEESAGRIVERARTTTQRQIARSNRVWREVQAEVARFASWREEVEPVIRAVQSKVEGVRAEIEEVPERIRQALAPMADSISSIDTDLADLAAACNPPLLLAPGGLESEDSDQGSWGAGAGEDEGFEDHAEASEGAFDDSFVGNPGEHFGRTYGESEGDEGSGRLHAG